MISYTYGASLGILCKAELMRHVKTKKRNIMINFDEVTGENRQEHNPDWPELPDHPYRVPIAGGSKSGKTNALLILDKPQTAY